MLEISMSQIDRESIYLDRGHKLGQANNKIMREDG
jgi:hypothetical protein